MAVLLIILKQVDESRPDKEMLNIDMNGPVLVCLFNGDCSSVSTR